MSHAELQSPNHSEEAVHQRYAKAAQRPEAELCCAVEYPRHLLDAIPAEILNVDYGCGDPTPYVRSGDTVLDLGSGSGKMAYILAQVVGREGRVIGVDCNQRMLALARRHRAIVAERLGYANVEFRCGMIQDLRLDLDRLTQRLACNEIRDAAGWLHLRSMEGALRRESPLVADDSIDCVVSNCVLNLVRPEDRTQLFREVFRVLRRGGRAVISDIVADEDIPPHLANDGRLWSGCISGAFREDRLLHAFEEAGFHGLEVVGWKMRPWRVVEGIEFRSITVSARKGKQGPCIDRGQAVIYRGPLRKVADDDGHVFRRGERVAVCDKTFRLLQQPPYEGMFEPVEPYDQVPLDQAPPFDCRRSRIRDPRETKGRDYHLSTEGSDCCDPDGRC